MSRRREWIVFAAVVFTAAALFLGVLEMSGTHTNADFICLYGAGKTILQGEGARLYDYPTQLQVQKAYTGHATPRIDFHALPEALLFVPFALLSYPAAYLLRAGVNLFPLGSCVFLLQPWFLKLSAWDLPLLAVAVLIPVLAAIWQGQDSLLVLFFYVVVLRLFLEGQDLKAGSVLALGLFKVELVAPFLILAVVRRGRRFLAGFLVVAAGLAVVSVAAVGVRATLGYPAFLLSLNQKTEWIYAHQVFPARMPNLRGLAYALFSSRVPGSFLNLGIAAASLALVLWAATARRPKAPPGSDGFAIDFSLDLLVTLIVSWYLYVYDLSLLFLPALVLLSVTTSGGAEGRREALLVRASLIVAFVGEIYGVAWFPKQFAGVCVGLLLLLWSCASLGLHRRSAAAA